METPCTLLQQRLKSIHQGLGKLERELKKAKQIGTSSQFAKVSSLLKTILDKKEQLMSAYREQVGEILQPWFASEDFKEISKKEVLIHESGEVEISFAGNLIIERPSIPTIVTSLVGVSNNALFSRVNLSRVESVKVQYIFLDCYLPSYISTHLKYIECDTMRVGNNSTPGYRNCGDVYFLSLQRIKGKLVIPMNSAVQHFYAPRLRECDNMDVKSAKNVRCSSLQTVYDGIETGVEVTSFRQAFPVLTDFNPARFHVYSTEATKEMYNIYEKQSR
ncbi:hypothetical protein HGA88_02855 [Candidatus Roizmanbacteria bacterium]|nr:hypothetical protein [Candidatus Roizmanbacteria bacterium]